MQGKLIAVALLCLHIEISSLWAEFVNKKRCISVRLVFYRNNFPSEHNTHFIVQHCAQYWVQYISDRGDLVTILESFVTYICNFRQPLVTSSLVIHWWITVNIVILYLSTFKLVKTVIKFIDILSNCKLGRTKRSN